ncbi:hypothetical protein [Spirosoma gilvum]
MRSRDLLNRSREKLFRLLTLGAVYCTFDLLLALLTYPALAQQPVETVYHIKVITKKGNRFRGTLWDVTTSNLYLEHEKRSLSGRIPFANIHKIVFRPKSKKNAIITGDILGGLAVGFITNQSLQRTRPVHPWLMDLPLGSQRPVAQQLAHWQAPRLVI